jgi:hypothetical protein
MKIRFALNLLVIAMTLIASVLGTGTPARAQTDPSDAGPSSAEAPQGYAPLNAPTHLSPDLTTEANVLLIQTALPWRSDADTQVLNALGYTYDIVDMSTISSVDLFSYPVILIVNDQVQAFYNQYAAQASEFEAYVSGGGTLVFFAAGAGWAGGQLTSPLPGGVQWTNLYDYNNTIADATHPIVTNLLSGNPPLTDADLYSNYCSHGYFTQLVADTNVIFRNSSGQPTLIEYRLGRGRVIASTQTWEHNWFYHQGGTQYGTFARKALDDVFLYAFSGGAVAASVSLDLRLDDAPANITINKSKGSYLDVVARVRGDAAYEVAAQLTVPAATLGDPELTFSRNVPGGAPGQENTGTKLATGTYVFTTTLQAASDLFYKEIVWRFKVPDNTAPAANLQLAGRVTVPGYFVREITDSARFNVIDYARSIILTNRRLLFQKYQPNPNRNDVSSLLEELYHQAWIYNGEVFYVDLYSEDARTWAQQVDYSSETNANKVAFAIDELLDGWYHRLSRRFLLWETSHPEFLLIVGGDEIIPFYRTDDRNYYSWLDRLRNRDDLEHRLVTIDNADPVGMVPHQHYFLSDNIYANVDGDLSDWKRGELQLSYGRIVGPSARAMLDFIHNAWLDTPSLTQAVIASRSSDHNLTTVRERLNSINANIYGEADPDLTENDQWTRAQWLEALRQPFQVLGYQGHGAYDRWGGTDAWTSIVSAADQPAGQMPAQHPLLAVEACNFAIPTDLNGSDWNPEPNDNISYKLITAGAGGILGSTAIDTTAGGNSIAYGERLHNDYFKYLIGEGSFTEYFGTALLKAKQNYPAGLTFDGTDSKTLMEYVYFGLPWSFARLPAQGAGALETAPRTPEGYRLFANAPTAEPDGSYSREIVTQVTSHSFAAQGPFELLEISGADQGYSAYEPVLPILNQTFSLPPGSSLTSLDLVGEHAISLGSHPIPSAEPVTEYTPGSGYTSQTSIVGLYPQPQRFGYEVRSFEDRVEVVVHIVPATFDTSTRAVTLFDETRLRINYTAPSPVVASELQLSSPSVQAGEMVTAHVGIGNVGASALVLSAQLDIFDPAGALLKTVLSEPFSVSGGQDFPLQLSFLADLSAQNYRAVLTVLQGGQPQTAAGSSFRVLTGRIAQFTSPAAIAFGEYGEFSLTFDNYQSVPLSATAKVLIYNSLGVEAASLLQKDLLAGEHMSATVMWAWDPTGLAAGTNYVAQALVQTEDADYLGPALELAVGSFNPLPAIVSLDPATGMAGSEAFELSISGSDFISGTEFTEGTMVRWNGLMMETQFISDHQLTASVPANHLLAGGTAEIDVVNPGPGGGASNSLAFTVNHPVPVLGSLGPQEVTVGQGPLTLQVTGANFVRGSKVRWNGVDLITVFVSGTQLSAYVPADHLLVGGAVDITVSNAEPGGGVSDPLRLTITVKFLLPLITR